VKQCRVSFRISLIILFTANHLTDSLGAVLSSGMMRACYNLTQQVTHEGDYQGIGRQYDRLEKIFIL